MFEVEIRGAVGGVERRVGLVGCEKDKVVEVVVVCAAVDIRMVISPSSSPLPSPVRLSGVPGLLPPLLPPAGSSPSDCCPPPSCSVFIALEEEREEEREERRERRGGRKGT